MDIEFTPEKDDALRVIIDLTSTTYAFDVPRSFLTIQGMEQGLIIDFVSEETGRILTGHAVSYSELYDILLKMTLERAEAMDRHPSSLQLIDGGGNKVEGK